MKILVLNEGSSSQKSCLYELANAPSETPSPSLWEATLEWKRAGELGGPAKLRVKNSQGRNWEAEIGGDASPPKVIHQMLETLWKSSARVLSRAEEIDVVGHRIVHGGEKYVEPTFITPEVKAAIADLAIFAPLHNRAALDAIEAIEQRLGPVPQVAVFDTAFHSRMPPQARFYGGPYEWVQQGIRRYGFHGVSHQYAAQRAAQIVGRRLEALRLITCHLGNGCSLAAIQDGRSIETTMGFTPLEGLMMGTRSGSVDPGLLIGLLRRGKYSTDELERTLDRQSGLLGISGISHDMREIEAAVAHGNPRAELAFQMYTHRLRWHIGAMLACLGGLDALVFTGGVGEHSAALRAAACEAFGFLGLELDAQKNSQSPSDADIAAADARIRVVVVRAREEWAIARECWKLLEKRRPVGSQAM